MMTVRFPNGQAVRYNRATFVTRCANYTDIYVENTPGGARGWIAQVPNTYLIEVEPACQVYDAMNARPLEVLRCEIQQLRRGVRALTRKVGGK